MHEGHTAALFLTHEGTWEQVVQRCRGRYHGRLNYLTEDDRRGL